jgi:hypothetical protein
VEVNCTEPSPSVSVPWLCASKAEVHWGMGKLQCNGQNLCRVFNSRSGRTCAIHFCCHEEKLPNLKLKTHPEQLLGYLPYCNVVRCFHRYLKKHWLLKLNAIPVSPDLNAVSVTWLYYCMMCLRMHFSGWRVILTPNMVAPLGAGSISDQETDSKS